MTLCLGDEIEYVDHEESGVPLVRALQGLRRKLPRRYVVPHRVHLKRRPPPARCSGTSKFGMQTAERTCGFLAWAQRTNLY